MSLDKWIDLLAKIGGLTVLVGGIPAGFLRYRQSRTYAPKLEIVIAGQLLKAESQLYLQIATRAKNIGLSRVAIEPDPSYLRVLTVEATNSPVSRIEPTFLDIFGIFNNHAWLEAGETVDDLLLMKVPHDNFLAFYVEVGVVSAGKEWTQTAIINCKLKQDMQNSE